ncbi:MAG: enoyl-CoA hydratase-related protein, partial [Acetobacteraceae bacterium]
MRTDFTTLTVGFPELDILEITLNRPEVSNALNTEMGNELLFLFDHLNAEPATARAVVLTGA